MEDRRRRLRAHWPPRKVQTVQLVLEERLYADLYLSAKAEGWSLQEEMRSRLVLSGRFERERHHDG